MKKIISMISGLGLLSSTISSTIACSSNATVYTIEYKSLSGFESSELSNVYFNSDNIPLIFITFVAPDQQSKFLILKNSGNDSSINKVRKFYDINSTSISYNEYITITDIKYSYMSTTCNINNQQITADFVTNIEFIK